MNDSGFTILNASLCFVSVNKSKILTNAACTNEHNIVWRLWRILEWTFEILTMVWEIVDVLQMNLWIHAPEPCFNSTRTAFFPCILCWTRPPLHLNKFPSNADCRQGINTKKVLEGKVTNKPLHLVNESLNDNHQMLKYWQYEQTSYAFTFLFW